MECFCKLVPDWLTNMERRKEDLIPFGRNTELEPPYANAEHLGTETLAAAVSWPRDRATVQPMSSSVKSEMINALMRSLCHDCPTLLCKHSHRQGLSGVWLCFNRTRVTKKCGGWFWPVVCSSQDPRLWPAHFHMSAVWLTVYLQLTG